MRIAVIVPVYNVAPYVKRCIDSLLKQTYRDFRLLLVDDGSTDGSGAICDSYAAQDARVCVIRQVNGGLSSARNAALDKLVEESSADYVTFVDSDDWVDVRYLEELVRGLSDGAEIALARFYRTDRDKMPVPGKVDWRTMSPREAWLLPEADQSAACGKLYALRLFEGIRYPVGRINEDEFTTYRVFFRAGRVACTESSLYAYYMRPGSIMCSLWSPRRLDRLDAWRDQVRFFSKLGYGELVAKSRKWLSVDLADAVRHLQDRGERAEAERLRAELVAVLKAGRFPISGHYLVYKTAHPIMARLIRIVGRNVE